MDYTYKYEIYKLSAKFEADYPISKYPEILYKSDLPHFCLLIDTHCNYFICVPFRSNIDHKNAFLFKNTNRSKRTHSGIDYSKMIIIKDITYLDNTNVVVDQDEYIQAIKHIQSIVLESVNYLNTYINHVNGTKILHEKNFNRRYKFTTLKYFHNILNLPHLSNTSATDTSNLIII